MSSLPDVVSIAGHREISVLQLGTVMRQCQSIELGLADVKIVLDVLRKTCSKIEEQMDSMANGVGELKIFVNSLRPSLPIEMVRETDPGVDHGAASTVIQKLPNSNLTLQLQAPNTNEITTPDKKPTPTTPANTLEAPTSTPSSSPLLRIKIPGGMQSPMSTGGKQVVNILGGDSSRNGPPVAQHTESLEMNSTPSSSSVSSALTIPQLPSPPIVDPEAEVNDQRFHRVQDETSPSITITPRSSTTFKSPITPSVNRKSLSRRENNNSNIALPASISSRSESVSRQKTRWDPNAGKRVPVAASASVVQAVKADPARSEAGLLGPGNKSAPSEVLLVSVSGVIQTSNQGTAVTVDTSTSTATTNNSNCNDHESSQTLDR